MKKTIYFLLLCGICAVTSCSRSECICSCSKAGAMAPQSYSMDKDACRNASTTTNITVAKQNGWDTCTCALAK